ncbi:M20 family peptidase [Sorangium sp. So ce131]|uniref:M20 family peptidase n=1 Tax=Sorangium sp. So ce131 TaxID=3133282 RepID=UPI003F6334EF
MSEVANNHQRDGGASDEGSSAGEAGARKGPSSLSARADRPSKRRGVVGRVLRFIGLGVVLLLLLLFVKALTTRSHQVVVEAAEGVPVDEAKAAEHLARAITFKTISEQPVTSLDAQNAPSGGEEANGAAFLGLHKALEEMFPKTHQTLTREVVGGYSLLYTWKGKDAGKRPILLMAHQDVVPVEPGTEGDWHKPPYEGTIDGGYVWGRGSIDFKNGVVGILEAVEALLNQGHAPSRTVYLAFGHDEELGGQKGASAIVELLASRGVRLDYALDEGMFITQGIIKGIARPVSLIGLAEKGYVSLELVVETEGGHSSVPPRPTSVGLLARALDRLENNPIPASLDGPARQLFETLAPEMPLLPNRLILSNLWLLEPVATRSLAGNPATAAMIRTTTAPTMLDGGIKDNVLPKRVRAVVNFRIRPGDTVQSVIEHVERTVADPRVKVQILGGGKGKEPSPVSSVTSFGYTSIEKTIRQIFPDAIVAPSLVLGGTDSAHYQRIADGVYRFCPTRLLDEDRARFHGTNERISVKNFAEVVRFYAQLIKNADAP